MLFPETCKRLRNASVKELLATKWSALLPSVCRHAGWSQRLVADRLLMQVLALMLLYSHWNPVGKISASVKCLPRLCVHTHTHTCDCRWGLVCSSESTMTWHAPLFHMPCEWERFLIVCLPHICPVLWQSGAANVRTTLCAVVPGKSECFQPLKVQNGLNPQWLSTRGEPLLWPGIWG